MANYIKTNRFFNPSFLIILLTVVLLQFVMTSCKKDIISGEPADDGMIAILIARSWHFKSATYFTNSGSITSRYGGANGDSVLFLYGQDRNFGELVLTNISSFIGGGNRLMKYSVVYDNLIKRNSTILTSPGWKDGYSDTLSVTYYSNYTLVFKVKDSVGTGYEIDSLYRTY